MFYESIIQYNINKPFFMNPLYNIILLTMFYESIILYVINKPCFMNPLYYEKIIEQVILPGLFLITTPLTWDAGGGDNF